jgi:16S rRNA (cytidine1402-2'-O)-methyltransferase
MALSTERRDRMTPLEKDSVRPEPDALSAGLYVVATPIGRLSDLSLRATDVLRRVDALGAEDTRVSRQLLDHIGARPTLIACHAHNEARTAQALVERIRAGQAVALISDAGTPGISDPGARVVAAVHAAGLPVIPVPGPSAVVTLLSAAGFLEPRFRFEGFLPARATARRERLQELAASQDVVVFYESPHRIVETLTIWPAHWSPSAWWWSVASSPSALSRSTARPRAHCPNGWLKIRTDDAASL